MAKLLLMVFSIVISGMGITATWAAMETAEMVLGEAQQHSELEWLISNSEKLVSILIALLVLFLMSLGLQITIALLDRRKASISVKEEPI